MCHCLLEYVQVETSFHHSYRILFNLLERKTQSFGNVRFLNREVKWILGLRPECRKQNQIHHMVGERAKAERKNLAPDTSTDHLVVFM